MLSEDILLEILCNYFDRKFMETVLKLVSRKFAAIISHRSRAPPYLVLSNIFVDLKRETLSFGKKGPNKKRLMLDAFVDEWRYSAPLPEYLRACTFYAFTKLLSREEERRQRADPTYLCTSDLSSEYSEVTRLVLRAGTAQFNKVTLMGTISVLGDTNLFDYPAIQECVHLRLRCCDLDVEKLGHQKVVDWLHATPKIFHNCSSCIGGVKDENMKRKLLISTRLHISTVAWQDCKRKIKSAIVEIFMEDTTQREFKLAIWSESETKTDEDTKVELFNSVTGETLLVEVGADLEIERYKTKFA